MLFRSVFRFTGGAIRGTSDSNLPAFVPVVADDADLFPFRDADFGELVLGGGNASVTVGSDLTIENLRLRGPLVVNPSGGKLRIGNRLAFGRTGATLRTSAAGDLIVGNGGIVVRQGPGTLSHQPDFAGAIDLFYDLDDGDFSGEIGRAHV